MILTFLIGICFGVGWHLYAVRRLVNKRHELIVHLSMSMVCRGALKKLESGETEGVKKYLCFHIADFYRRFEVSGDQPDSVAGVITSEMKQIEAHAESSADLAAALKKTPVAGSCEFGNTP